jgi:ComF family protein
MAVIARTIFQSIFDFCLPRECPACRTGYESDRTFCPECEEEINQLELAGRCDRCSMPVTLPGAPCAQCLGKGLSPFEQIISLGVFKGPLQSAIRRMKYERRWALGEALTDRLIRRSDVRGLLTQADVLIPVPLHRQRQRSRGYNQADVIARRIGRDQGRRLHVAYPAERVGKTETQTHLHLKTQRFENLRHAFELMDAAAIANKHVVIVDDVLTTGATLVSFARILKPAKPASISAIVLAVADPKGRAFEVI